MSTSSRTSIRFTSRSLADGREIIYVDEPGTPERIAEDPRPVEPRVQSGELRHDALVDDWVAVAAHRQHRTFMPPKDECPLCPAGHGSVPSEIPERDYQVVVFENRFPSYAVTSVGADAPDPSGIFGTRPAVGRCEVVCFTSDHESSFKDLPVERVRTVIDTWAQRTEALGAIPEVEQVFAFENRGREIGVTLPHPHGQIYAYPYVPDRDEAAARGGSPPPRAHRSAARRRHPRGRAGRRLEGRRLGDALDGIRPLRSALAGRGAPGPAPRRARPRRRSTTRSATSWPSSTATCSAASTATTSTRTARRSRCPTSPPGSRPRRRPGATSRGCTCSSCRCCAGRGASSSSPDPSPASAAGSTTSPRRGPRLDCGRSPRERTHPRRGRRGGGRGLRADASAAPPRACGRPPAGSTSSASTPTTTAGCACRSPCRSGRMPPWPGATTVSSGWPPPSRTASSRSPSTTSRPSSPAAGAPTSPACCGRCGGTA